MSFASGSSEPTECSLVELDLKIRDILLEGDGGGIIADACSYTALHMSW